MSIFRKNNNKFLLRIFFLTLVQSVFAADENVSNDSQTSGPNLFRMPVAAGVMTVLPAAIALGTFIKAQYHCHQAESRLANTLKLKTTLIKIDDEKSDGSHPHGDENRCRQRPVWLEPPTSETDKAKRSMNTNEWNRLYRIWQDEHKIWLARQKHPSFNNPNTYCCLGISFPDIVNLQIAIINEISTAIKAGDAESVCWQILLKKRYPKSESQIELLAKDIVTNLNKTPLDSTQKSNTPNPWNYSFKDSEFYKELRSKFQKINQKQLDKQNILYEEHKAKADQWKGYTPTTNRIAMAGGVFGIGIFSCIMLQKVLLSGASMRRNIE